MKGKAFEKDKEVLNFNGWKDSHHKTAPQVIFFQGLLNSPFSRQALPIGTIGCAVLIDVK